MAQKMIHVDGLRQFQRDVKAISADLAKTIRKALNLGAELVADSARPMVPTVSGKARKSIKAASTQREGRVKAGGARVPYYPWLDFGGKVGRKRAIERRVVSGGRYLYPALADNNEKVYRAMVDGLLDVAAATSLEITE